MNEHGHYKTVCECGETIAQCRCFGPKMENTITHEAHQALLSTQVTRLEEPTKENDG